MYRAAHMRKSCLSCCYRRRRKWAVAFICWAVCTPREVKNKKTAHPELNHVFKLSSVTDWISLYLFTVCVFSVLAFVCNQKSVIKRHGASLRCGSLLSKGWTMPVLLWAFLCNKITQKRHFQEVQRPTKTLLSFYTILYGCLCTSGLVLFCFSSN